MTGYGNDDAHIQTPPIVTTGQTPDSLAVATARANVQRGVPTSPTIVRALLEELDRSRKAVAE